MYRLNLGAGKFMEFFALGMATGSLRNPNEIYAATLAKQKYKNKSSKRLNKRLYTRREKLLPEFI